MPYILGVGSNVMQDKQVVLIANAAFHKDELQYLAYPNIRSISLGNILKRPTG